MSEPAPPLTSDLVAWPALAWVAHATHDAVMLCNAQRLITWVNPAFTRLTGYTLAQAQGLLPDELLSGPHTDVATMAFINRQLSQALAIEALAMCLHHQDGEPFWALRSIQVLTTDEGTASAYLELLSPQAQWRRAEAEHARRVAAELALASKVEFLSRMSRSMRAPLNTVLGFAQLLERQAERPLPEPERSHVQHIHTAGQQLLSCLEETLHCAQIDDHLLDARPERLDLRDVLHQVRSGLASAAAAKGITVALDAPSVTVWADAQHSCAVLFKLLSNALQYSPPGGTVWLRCQVSLDGQMGIASVEDSGLGIDLGDLPRLFQPFTRLGKADAHAHGNGLGLAVAHGLAELMHGRIEVRSTLGQGSVFGLYLPLAPTRAFARPAAAEARTPDPLDEALAAVWPSAEPHLPALRIVHVEDHVLNQSLVEAMLSGYPQVTLHTLSTAAEGWGFMQAHPPDVALIDINLPDGSGLDLCRRVRAQAQFKALPLIAVSADAMPEHIAQALQTGFDHYLVKPLQAERLLHLLAHVRPA